MANVKDLLVNGSARIIGTIYGNATSANNSDKLDGKHLNEIAASKSTTLAWNASSTVATIGGNNITVTMPANPNTWRGVQNNLTSDSTTDSLSAAQGKALKSLVDGKAASSHTHDDRYYTESEINTKLNAKLNTSLKGSAGGLAELDSNGKVPSTQLPSYVDDVIEGYLYNSKFYKESGHTTEIAGETGKIYVDLSNNKTYRWSGSTYAVISETLALGETSSTAYRGDRGKIAYDHSQSTHARTDATKVEASSSNGKIKINGSDATVYTHPSYTAKNSGLYKVTVDGTGHVSATTAVTKADITALGIPGSDTNTWRPVVDNLTSTATDSSLSANQGKVLKGLIDGKAASSHTHNYAGSASAGGSANSAVKLDTATAGDSNTPVYFSGGKPVACSSLDLNTSGTAAGLSSVIANDKLPPRLRVNTSPTNASIDSFKQSGFWYAATSGISNVGDVNVISINHSDGGWGHQLAFKFNGTGASGTAYDGADIYTRLYNSSNSAWTQWHTILSSGNFNKFAPTLTGGGASGTWGISITGSAGSVAWSNVIGKPSTYTPSSHIHSNITYIDTRDNNQSPDGTIDGLSVHLKGNNVDGLSDGGTYHAVLNVKDWGDYSGGPYWQSSVTSNNNMYFRRSTSGTEWGTWQKVLSDNNYTNYTVTKTGSGASGNWGISISGNAATATKLSTARTISLTGSVTGSGTFDGSGNLSISTTTNHNHEGSYLSYSGWWSSGSGQNVNDASGMIFAYSNHGMPGSWGVVTTFEASKDSSYRHQIYGDGANGNMYFRTCSSDTGGWHEWRHLLDSNNYTSYTVTKTGSGASGTWGINVTGSSASCTGNAATATKLNTARTISLTGSVTGSGTFDGSGNLSIATTTNHNHDDRYYTESEIDTKISELNSNFNGNLLCPTLLSDYSNGVSCNYNNDGTYRLNGTASALTKFIVGTVYLEPGKQYKILGCPSGGGNPGYRISDDQASNSDMGDGIVFTATDRKNEIKIVISNGVDASGLIFKPMVTENLGLTYNDFKSFDNSYVKGRESGAKIDLVKQFALAKNHTLATSEILSFYADKPYKFFIIEFMTSTSTLGSKNETHVTKIITPEMLLTNVFVEGISNTTRYSRVFSMDRYLINGRYRWDINTIKCSSTKGCIPENIYGVY